MRLCVCGAGGIRGGGFNVKEKKGGGVGWGMRAYIEQTCTNHQY